MADTSTSSPFADLNPPYATIVADPPWPYEDATRKKGTGGRALVGSGGTGRNNHADQVTIADNYSAMSIADLRALPVSDLAAKDAHLYLWTTNSFMNEAYDVARAWGFKPKTVLTWVKVHQDDPSRVSMKTGYYFRGATEHALFCVRGSLPLQTSEGLPTAYLWPRIGEHSRKPEAFADLVEKASPGPYLDLFCRRPRLGWDSWGHGYELSKTTA